MSWRACTRQCDSTQGKQFAAIQLQVTEATSGRSCDPACRATGSIFLTSNTDAADWRETGYKRLVLTSTPSSPSHHISVFEYLTRRKTPARELADAAVATHLAALTGTIVELGATGEGRKRLALAATKYLATNITADAEMQLDAKNMHLADNSIDALLCESMLEHVDDPERVVSEVHRVLRPGGKFLLLTPWMYPYHPAPDDYLRLSESALSRMLSGFEIVKRERLGNYWTAMSTFAQLKVHPWGRGYSKPTRVLRTLLGTPLLGVGFGFHLINRFATERDEFSPMLLFLAEKRANS